MQNLYVCRYCGQKNNLRPEIGTKSVRCGNPECREPLPTPEILRRLQSVRAELISLDSGFKQFGNPRDHKQIASRLRRQQAILAQLPDYPGYRSTRLAMAELVLEIEGLATTLRMKLDTTAFKQARDILAKILEFLFGAKLEIRVALPPGSGD
jgi:hypothetical protein